MIETNELNTVIPVNDGPKCEDGTPIHKRSVGAGRPKGSLNLHAKHPSSITKRLKAIGIDWIDSFGKAIQRNDKELLRIWLKLLPFLIVTAGHRQPKRLRGRASKAALEALKDLENE